MATLSFLKYLRGIYQINLSSTTHKVQHAVIQSIYDCFVMAKDDIDYMRLEMCLTTATGYWLDCWGDYFSVYRKINEADEHYSKRIIDSIIKPKSTIPAIKDNIVDYLNSEYGTDYTREDVSIKEPWKDIAKYSHKGGLSDTARFFSGDYYTHAVIDVSIPEEVTQDIVDLANSVKAAGVKIIWSILNSYDIVSGFNTADDAWASYHRWIQTQTKRNQFTGLVLSNSSPNPKLSGNRMTWSWITSYYAWYAVIQDKKTDDSIIITKKDLIGLVDYYTDIEGIIQDTLYGSLNLSEDGTISDDKKMSGDEVRIDYVEKLVKITDDMLANLELLDAMMTLSNKGRMSTSEGVMFHHMAEHDVFGKIFEEVKKFKEQHPDYYNALQPPILNGERAMWLVERNKNWLWNTPTMTYEDFLELWEPFDDYEESYYQIELDGSTNVVVYDGSDHNVVLSTGTKLNEHTVNSIIEFEDAYYNGYLTFGDKYQPPIVVGDKFRWTHLYQEWLWKSPVFLNEDLPEIFRRQFTRCLGELDHPNPTLGELQTLEKRFNYERYSVSRDSQPEITITTEPISNS